MIRYRLTCPNGHSFDSWFASSTAFDSLQAAGQVTCVQCGATDVRKSLMAPQVQTEPHAPLAPTPPAAAAPVSAPASAPQPAENPIERLRAEVEANSEDVGTRFADEARAIHLGDAPERQIHGEARPEEARALVEDGVPILPLPFVPKSKVN